MISSYIKLALRNLAKHRLYAFINITGLALGLCLYIFSAIIVSYEFNHDDMFSKRDRIFVVNSIFSETSGESILQTWSIRTAYGPLFKQEIKEIEHVARAIFKQRLLTIKNKNFYHGIRFVDSGFTRIFDFNYIYGDASAIDDPHGVIITESTAKKLFKRVDVLGETLTLEHQYKLHVSAVIKDLPANNHFQSALLPDFELSILAPMHALVNIDDFKIEGDWTSLTSEDITYILLPENFNHIWLDKKINAVSARHAPENESEYVRVLEAHPLSEVNRVVWDAIGMPVLESAKLLGLLILLIACVNYTNLATAQSFSRTREIGLRKTFGAGQAQLLIQFFVESLTIAVFAMIIALSGIELLIPVYNSWTGRSVPLDYSVILPWLLLTTIITGLLAGAYPAYSISQFNPIDSLHNTILKGRKGSIFRSFMIGTQFSISIFLLAMVMIIYFQNQKVLEQGNTVPKSRIVVLAGIEAEEIKQKHETLRQELNALTGVQAVTFSSAIPFWDSGNTSLVTPVKNDATRSFKMNTVSIDADFMDIYNIKLLAGQGFERPVANNVMFDGSTPIQVIINQLAAKKLGFGSAENVIGKTFYRITDEHNPQPQEYIVTGLRQDNHFFGMTTKKRPMTFLINPDTTLFGSIKVTGEHLNQTLNEIDAVWNRVIKNYPIQRSFLDDYFNLLFRILQGINTFFAAFAAVALSLALIGLFGLAAFMAKRRTKEIGMRKVMGASMLQIVRLLIWQFSLPVMWSLLVAVPMAYLASDTYLNFFPIRIDFVIPVILLASVVGILTAWIIVAEHAIRIATAAPIKSLRYE